MKQIDVSGISKDPTARLAFLTDFVGFGDDDWQAIRDSAATLGPVLPQFLDGLYEHLLSYDHTRSAFESADGKIDEDYMAVRKEHLTGWVLRMVAGLDAGPDAFAKYLVNIAKRHTTMAGEPHRSVPPRYVVAITGFIQDRLLATLFDLMPDNPREVRRLGLAWNKLLVIQLEIFLSVMGPQWPRWDEDSEAAP